MADLSDIRDKLKARLETITGLRVYDTWPDQIVHPAAIIKPTRWERQALNGVNSFSFEIIILAAPLDLGFARGQEALDGYLDDTGSTSIYAALNGDKHLQNTVDTLNTSGWRDYGSIDVNGIEYVGVIFDIEVWD